MASVPPLGDGKLRMAVVQRNVIGNLNVDASPADSSKNWGSWTFPEVQVRMADMTL